MTMKEIIEHMERERAQIYRAINNTVRLREKMTEEDDDIYGEFFGAIEAAGDAVEEAFRALARRYETNEAE